MIKPLTAHKRHLSQMVTSQKGWEPPVKTSGCRPNQPTTERHCLIWHGLYWLRNRGTVAINSRAESRQESPHSGVTLTYSHRQVEGGDFVFLWSHGHGWLKDGAQRQQEGDSLIGVRRDVVFGEISGPEGGRVDHFI